MLTIKSNFNNFRDRQGQLYIAEDLDKLCKALVTSDIVNFPVKKEMSAGYTEAIAWKIADRLVLVENGKYLVINDISLQVANALTDLGVKPENIYLAYGKWKKNAVPDPDPTLYLLMKQYIKANIVETFNIIKLEEIFTLDIKFNGVIANPPYGKIGAQITEKIKDNIDCEQYINLLPANDYKRVKELHQFVRNMEAIRGGFADAAVTTHLCEIVKEANSQTVADFEIEQYLDLQLIKYFKANTTRSFNYNILQNTISENVVDSFFVPMRLSSGDHSGEHHLPYSKNCLSYKVNTNLITYAKAAEEYAGHYSYTGDANGNYFAGNSILFNNATEKENFSTFVYSSTGFRFVSKLLTAIHKDSRVPVVSWFPKVDWTQTWTVEEILADYGYTKTEIAEVMADLENFKDMERD